MPAGMNWQNNLTHGLSDAQKQVVLPAAMKAAGAFGAMTIGNAQDYTPEESGFLQGSATWEDPKLEGGEITMQIGFNADYAAARHERPPEEDAPPRQNPRGQWKFLERALREMTPKFGPFVADAVRAALGG